MKAIDEIFTDCPFYGHRKIRWELNNKYQLSVGRKKTLSLMKQMGLEPIYPKKKPNLSVADKFHHKFPYLLKDLKIAKPNQVWGTDITYIRLEKGFAYLSAILDWYSRYVVSWRLSLTLENDFCIQALKEALESFTPGIFNSDQGVQYTSKEHVEVLQKAKVRISMDGRGRCMDNIFTERLWKTVKYENVYLNDYENFDQARDGIARYFDFYNNHRIHQALDYQTPAQIFFSK